MEISKELKEQAETAYSVAIMQLMRNSSLAFDSSILLNMERQFKIEEDLTLKVEGTTVYVNPEWFLSISKNDQQWNLRHLAWHIIGFDELRVGDKDPKRWNLACDLYNNALLHNDSSFKCTLPQNAVYDPRFDNMDKEEIYKYLEDNQEQEQQQEQKQDPTAGDCGGGQQPEQDGDQEGDGEGDGDQEKEGNGNQQRQQQLEKEISNMVQQAAMQAKQAGGAVPPSIEQYLDELYNPKLPWNRLLLKYMTSHAAYDYSYQRIHKKFFPHGMIMPSMWSEGMGPLVIATDESCSVSDEDIKLYKGAIQAIKDEFNPEKLTVMGFTTRVEHTTVIAQDAEIDNINFRAHGGTHIPAVMEYIEKEKIDPQVLICFSDMYSSFPPKPKYDVIWICVGNPSWQPPYGRVVYVDS
ncbi:metallopeptidase domain protein [Vibrio phage BUCT194]|uniref:Metallopeptidase domain protein n=1 Tax=Vibrio phage BUCT194 TaxID=2859072 RepID=A0AAE8XFS4_9CAUD|nr:HNH endonuclease [Vibrio phage BUCT194]UAW01133.1 metallopeptidase domain protein [Vibrio phage BUCT194]